MRSGTVTFLGKDLRAVPPHDRAGLEIGYMPEDRRLIPDLTVEENVLVPAWAIGDAEGAAGSLVYDILPEVKEFAPRRALQLSGGRQALVALARALICGRRLLVLDEPFEGVAPALARRLVEAIAALKAAGVSVLLSESDYVHRAISSTHSTSSNAASWRRVAHVAMRYAQRAPAVPPQAGDEAALTLSPNA